MNLIIACAIVFFVLFGGAVSGLLVSTYRKIASTFTVDRPRLPSIDIHYKIEWWKALLLGVAIYLASSGLSFSGCKLPSWAIPTLHSPVTAVTYVYEKDDGDVPVAVRVAFDLLNRKGITANPFEDDTRDGNNEVPDQYKVALEAANKAGLPSLVATAGQKVIRVVKAPTKVEEVLEAAK